MPMDTTVGAESVSTVRLAAQHSHHSGSIFCPFFWEDKIFGISEKIVTAV